MKNAINKQRVHHLSSVYSRLKFTLTGTSDSVRYLCIKSFDSTNIQLKSTFISLICDQATSRRLWTTKFICIVLMAACFYNRSFNTNYKNRQEKNTRIAGKIIWKQYSFDFLDGFHF